MERINDATLLEDMEVELHDLCQPLTLLMFQLEAAKWAGELDGLQESVEAGLKEAERMNVLVERMRGRLQRERAARQ